jgi:hypothetical protein
MIFALPDDLDKQSLFKLVKILFAEQSLSFVGKFYICYHGPCFSVLLGQLALRKQ